MTSKAAITVHKPREEVQRLWNSSEYRPRCAEAAETVVFKDAPGDRGTEIHVDLGRSGPAGKLGEVVQTLSGGAPLPNVKDDLRPFKQHVETGEIPRSDGSPEGERVERKLKQRPAQPLEQSELEEVGVR
jgi:uncharacterized membrane protein